VAEWFVVIAFAAITSGIPVAVLSAGLGKSLLGAAALGLLAITPFILLPVILRLIIGSDPMRRARYLALAGGTAFLLALLGSGHWAILDAAFAAVLLMLGIRPQIIDSIPERARFDWAGARAEGFIAPRGASVEYPFKLAVVAMLSVPFAMRGLLACVQASLAYASGASIAPALLPALGSALGYTSSLAILASLHNPLSKPPAA
jgi:hypothetical protein